MLLSILIEVMGWAGGRAGERARLRRAATSRDGHKDDHCNQAFTRMGNVPALLLEKEMKVLRYLDKSRFIIKCYGKASLPQGYLTLENAQAMVMELLFLLPFR